MKDHKSNFDRMMHEAKVARGMEHPENAPSVPKSSIPPFDQDKEPDKMEELRKKIKDELGDDAEVVITEYDMSDPEQAREALSLFQQGVLYEEEDEEGPEGDLMEVPNDDLSDDAYDHLMRNILGEDWMELPEPGDTETFEEYLDRSGLGDAIKKAAHQAADEPILKMPEVAGEGGSTPINQVENPAVEDMMREYANSDWGVTESADHTDHAATRQDILESAEGLVNGARNNQYGDPVQDFRRTGDLWTTYLHGIMEREGDLMIEPHDVAIMQILLKISRLTWSPNKKDHWVDIAGYAACGADCAKTVFDGWWD